MDEILNQFSSHAPREKRIALQVVDYELPEHGSETPENARVIGIDTKTGQMIEVALRPYEGDRPSLGQFYDDSASSTPVTTRPGGFLIVEGAVPTQELKPLSGQNHAVYSARWLMRAGMNEDHGRAMIATARLTRPCSMRWTQSFTRLVVTIPSPARWAPLFGWNLPMAGPAKSRSFLVGTTCPLALRTKCQKPEKWWLRTWQSLRPGKSRGH